VLGEEDGCGDYRYRGVIRTQAQPDAGNSTNELASSKSRNKWDRSGLSLKLIPCGLSSAPLRVEFPNDPAVELNLIWGVVQKDTRIAPQPILE
jgi:hypothetical protein